MRAEMYSQRLSLVMTAVIQKRSFAISRPDTPEVCFELPYPRIRGRRECRVPVAPAASCALGIGRTHTSNNEYTGITRHSPRNGFTVSFVLLCPQHLPECGNGRFLPTARCWI